MKTFSFMLVILLNINSVAATGTISRCPSDETMETLNSTLPSTETAELRAKPDIGGNPIGGFDEDMPIKDHSPFLILLSVGAYFLIKNKRNQLYKKNN